MFFTYLRRGLRRRGGATLLLSSVPALGIALVIVVSAVSAGTTRAQGEVLRSLYGLGTDLTVAGSPAAAGAAEAPGAVGRSGDRVLVRGRHTLASSTVARVDEQSGVADAAGGIDLTVLKADGPFSRAELKQPRPQGRTRGALPRGAAPGAGFGADSFTVYGTDVAKRDLGPLTTSRITSGRTFRADESTAKVAVVDSAYARERNLAIGAGITVSGDSYAVIGVATADTGDAAADVYLPLAQAQTLANAKDEITAVYVRAADSQRVAGVKSAIQKNVAGTTVTTSADLPDAVSGSLATASSLASGAGHRLAAAVLAAAFLAAGLLTWAAVGRRTREFGTLKALGWNSGRITRQVLAESLVNALLGAVLGIALGLAGAYAVTAAGPTLTARLGDAGGGGAGRHSAARAVDTALTAPVSLTTVGLAVALAVAGGLVAGGLGGWRAARLRPADAQRRAS
ncbi:ABC transporter permease [Streptomyces sp. cg36]|uniref:ABC transporter permease n=1 Tax=Streptomyces sp. cg36 TaxID=3238798 RepID=UPI0034E2C752